MMRNVQISLLFIFLTFSAFTQNTLTGVYYFTSQHVVQRLNLMSDFKSLITINSRGNKTEIVGNWIQKNDTVIIIEKTMFKPKQTVELLSDTLYFKVHNLTCLKRLLKNENNIVFKRSNIKIKL